VQEQDVVANYQGMKVSLGRLYRFGTIISKEKQGVDDDEATKLIIGSPQAKPPLQDRTYFDNLITQKLSL